MYEIANPVEKAMSGMSKTAGTYGAMMPNIPANQKPGPSVGGAAMAGIGGATGMAALAGTEMGGAALTALGISNPVGLGIGAALGIGAYLLS